MSKFNPLSAAIGYALLAGTMSLAASSAFAQQSEPAQDEEEAQVLDAIVVTGTRIQSRSAMSSAPVTEIDRQQFTVSGATRVDDLVNQYPQLSPAFDSQTNNPSTGYATVSLRDLGAERTLTLVNGRRLPPGPAGELRDISIIPAALIQRVDVLTGGASAVYGSDAVAGVVNFILDTEFEGVSIGAGWSAYQHDNSNDFMQGLQRARNFPFEDGNSGFDGAARNVDLAVGGSFSEGRGHAMAWLTYRQNDPLFQAQRDYASCTLGQNLQCGGSNTNASGNFYFYNADVALPANIAANGRWQAGYGAPYNFAPLNYYQRPDERYTAGASVRFEVNEYFTPYLETMMINREDSQQLAPTGTFFTPVSLLCTDPLLRTACADLGITTTDPMQVYVARRNVEGGGRLNNTTDNTFRFVVGSKGQLTDNWQYDASYLFARTNNDIQGTRDWITSRVASALLGCPAGNTFAGCLPYNVWQPGGVTTAAGRALEGTSLSKTRTEMRVLNAYVSGDLGFGFPSADGGTIWTAFGVESRRENYSFLADNDTASGNFIGTGTSAPAIDEGIQVDEFFAEAMIPVFAGDGFVKSIDVDAGYRYSDYDLSGGANTYKLGFNSDLGAFRVRGGYNRAIRAPGINDLFATRRVGLWNGEDPCAGTVAQITARGFTQAQCARTGVSAAQFGSVPIASANQFNQLAGGTSTLEPEQADTWTIGFVVSPIDNLAITVDYFDVKIEDAITSIGSQNILEGCALNGDPFLCNRIRRAPGSGALHRNNNAFVINALDNFGELRTRGVDLSVNYDFEAFGGRFAAAMAGSYLLEDLTSPVPTARSLDFDCTGLYGPSCQNYEWRHIASLNYARDRYSVNLRWRYFGALDYKNPRTGADLTSDPIVNANDGIGSYSYFDLSGNVQLFDNVVWTVGVNNIADKEPPLVTTILALNGNAPGGYDQLGRYVFSSINIKF